MKLLINGMATMLLANGGPTLGSMKVSQGKKAWESYHVNKGRLCMSFISDFVVDFCNTVE